MAWQGDNSAATLKALNDALAALDSEESADFSDETTQNPPALDTLDNANFGGVGDSADGLMGNDGVGSITILKTGPIIINQYFEISAGAVLGIAQTFLQPQLSTDGGSNWSNITAPIYRSIPSVTNVNVNVNIPVTIYTAGTKFRTLWGNSSTGAGVAGVNSGLLLSVLPSAAMIALGIQFVPSARFVARKMKGYKYI